MADGTVPSVVSIQFKCLGEKSQREPLEINQPRVETEICIRASVSGECTYNYFVVFVSRCTTNI